MCLIEAQNRFVKDELALSRITVVVAIIHLEALIRCFDLLGSVDIRVDHIDLALGGASTWSSSAPGLAEICHVFSCRPVFSTYLHVCSAQCFLLFFMFCKVLSKVLSPISAKEVDIS